MIQQTQQRLQRLERQAQQSLTAEQRQLIVVIMRLLHPPTSSSVTHPSTRRGTPDARAIALYACKQQRQLTALQAEELLQACVDTRVLAEDTQQKVEDAGTVHVVGWSLLSQQFSLDSEAVLILIRYLGDEDALICAAAARLLKNDSRNIPVPARKEAAQKIMEILGDDVLSRRPLDPPYSRVCRLDDVLFETLSALVE